MKHITIKELREALAGLPDDSPCFVAPCEHVSQLQPVDVATTIFAGTVLVLKTSKFVTKCDCLDAFDDTDQGQQESRPMTYSEMVGVGPRRE